MKSTEKRHAVQITNKFSDNIKQEALEYVLNNSEMQNPNLYLRQQIGILYESSHHFAKIEKRDNKYGLKHEDIAFILGLSVDTVKYHYQKYKKEKQGKILPNGRPKPLTTEELDTLKKWLDDQCFNPKPIEVIEFIKNKFNKNVEQRTLTTILKPLGYKKQFCLPMEAERYFCNEEKLAFYYHDLEMFTRANNISSCLCFNLDEEGHDDFVDKKAQDVIVKVGSSSHFYPVPRKDNRATFLACVSASGDATKPLIITKRKTAETSLLLEGITPDKVMLGFSEKGYITSTLFNEWLLDVFKPFVIETREKYGLPTEVGMILLDGASSHMTETFFTVCRELNLKIFFLPAHSSHMTQPLDLVLFHSHKNNMRKSLTNEQLAADLTKKIMRMYKSWCTSCTPPNIMGSFRAAGCIYELGGPSFHYIRFEKQASRFGMENLTEEEKTEKSREIFEKWNKEMGSRISVNDFNHFHLKVKEMKPIRKQEYDPSSKTYLLKLLIDACIPVTTAVLDDDTRPQQGRLTRKQVAEKNVMGSGSAYTALTFEEKLALEVESIFGL